MFGEPSGYAEANREAAAKIKVEPAHLASKTYGVVLFYSRFFMTLTREEAVNVATMLVNSVDEADRLQEERPLRRKITRSYQKEVNTND